MKLDTYVSGTDTNQDLFTFPHNSRVFSPQIEKFVDQKDYNYAFSYFGVTKGIKSRIPIAINGFFDDTGTGDRVSNIKSLTKHCNDTNLKKLFFSDSLFYIVIPQGIQFPYNPGRTMFRDYIANFISPFGLLFSATSKSGEQDETGEENEGNVFTPVEKITTSGVSNSDVLTYEDSNGNGFTITADDGGGGSTYTMTIYLVKMVDIGADAYFTEYWYAEMNNTKQVLSLANNNKTMIIGLDAGDTIADQFNTNVPANTTIYFRDGYSAE